MKSRSLVKLSVKEPVKIEPIDKFAAIPKELKSELKNFRAAAVVDKNGAPKYFIFDTGSLWDLLCAFDERFEKSAPAKEYVFNNPVGWLIDGIEGRLPINPKLASRLKKGIEEAQTLGLVSFDKIKHKLGLS